MRKTTLAGAIAVAALAASPAAAGAATTTSYLDSHSAPTTNGYVGPSTNSQVLAMGKNYAVNVAGTISVYSKASWANRRFTLCGSTFFPPSFKSAGIDNTGPTGSYFAFRYASLTTGSCPTLPQNTTNGQFSLDGGVTWVSPGPFVRTPNSSVFNYKVVGEGHALKVRYFDPAPQDNYGRFRIRVMPTK